MRPVRFAGLALALFAVACGRGGGVSPRERTRGEALFPAEQDTMAVSGDSTRTEMRGLALRMMEGVTLHVDYLSGMATPVHPGTPVILDEPTSYRLRIDRGKSRIGYADLARLLNDGVFNYKGAPIRSLRAEREHDEGEEVRLELKGRLAAMGLPFEIEGTLETTPDGRVRVHTRSIQALGIGVTGLLDLLGIETEDVGDFKRARGIEVDGNDMILDPGRMMAPPEASGRVTSVALEPDGIVMGFGDTAIDDVEMPGGERFLRYRGGTVRLGRMTMSDADLQIFDAYPDDPFDFYPADMNRQIAAGYVKVQLNGGLVIVAPDYARIDEADLRLPHTN